MRKKQKTTHVIEHKNTTALSALSLEQKDMEDGGKLGILKGFASTFGNVDSYGDTINPNAYDKTIQETSRQKPIRFLWQHRMDMPIGIITHIRTVKDAGEFNGKTGLYFEAHFNLETQRGREAYSDAKMGVVDSISIGFRPIKSRDREDGIRELQEIALVELSLVTDPADAHATVEAVKSESSKSLQAMVKMGYSEEEAKAVLTEASQMVVDRLALADEQHTAENNAAVAKTAEESREMQDFLHSMKQLNAKLNETKG